MTPDVWYVDGSGLLVGAERRWLLLDDVPDEAFVATLWETIAGSSVDRVLGVLENHYGDRMPSLAMTGAGREISRGAGEVTSDRDGMMLSLGPPAASAAAGQRRPFRGGVVSAALVEIPVDVAGGPHRRSRLDRRHPRRRAGGRRPRHPGARPPDRPRGGPAR